MLWCLVLLLAMPEVLPQPVDTPNTVPAACTSHGGKQCHIQNISYNVSTLIN